MRGFVALEPKLKFQLICRRWSEFLKPDQLVRIYEMLTIFNIFAVWKWIVKIPVGGDWKIDVFKITKLWNKKCLIVNSFEIEIESKWKVMTSSRCKQELEHEMKNWNGKRLRLHWTTSVDTH